MQSNVDEPETWDEQHERLTAMAGDDLGCWDLSDNDKAAIRAALMRLDELEAARAVVESTRGPFDMHAGYADAATCDCRRCTVARARDAYDAAKAGKAVE